MITLVYKKKKRKKKNNLRFQKNLTINKIQGHKYSYLSTKKKMILIKFRNQYKRKPLNLDQIIISNLQLMFKKFKKSLKIYSNKMILKTPKS